MKRKGPPVPQERNETIRQAIVAAMRDAGRPLSAVELAAAVGVRERDVFDHMEHVRLSLGRAFVLQPASCRTCGFEFRDRDRTSGPGRCPACRSERLTPPLFGVEGGEDG
ncbi:MAG: transcriptional regulator [Deltaproteobacteria bacterium]|nr:transcriptional regulator [Deltaproteobacteria bacterium]